MDGKYVQSHAYYDRAGSIPGRSLTRSKAPGRLFAIDAGPLYASSGDGAILHDADGNSFIDMICALGAISLGYGAVDRWLGPVYSLPHAVEVDATEAVLKTVAPWATSCRFVKTGSEAMTAAVMIARKATGRRRVLVADPSYHGWHPWTSQRGEANTDGEWTSTYRYGDAPSNEFGEVAAVIIEPARWQVTPQNYFTELQQYAHNKGALFIVDEMIWGARVALGGACERFGITPDLAAFGKAIGNGSPIACVVGGAALAEHGEMISGTYSGDTGALAAVCHVLDVYRDEPVIETLWVRGAQLRRGLRQVLTESPFVDTAFVEGEAVHQRLRFSDATLGKRFAAEMAARGVLWHPDVVNICHAHTVAQIDQVIAAAAESLKALA